MAICPNCSSEIVEGAVFCTNCGTPVSAPAAPVEPAFAEPTYAPAYAEPQQPAYQQPAYAEPQQSAYQQPAYAEPQQPTYQQPVYAEPQQPAYQQPAYAEPQQPVYQQPAYTQPQYSAYQQPVSTQPQPSTASKIMGPIGFGLGMSGFVFGIITFFMAIAAMDLYYAEDELTSAITMAFMFLGCAIAGIILSGKARSGGNLSTLPKLGKIFGIIGTVICGLSIFISIIGLA